MTSHVISHQFALIHIQPLCASATKGTRASTVQVSAYNRTCREMRFQSAIILGFFCAMTVDGWQYDTICIPSSGGE